MVAPRCDLVVASPRWRVARAGLVSGQNDCKKRGALGSSLARRLREAAGEFLKAAQVPRARILAELKSILAEPLKTRIQIPRSNRSNPCVHGVPMSPLGAIQTNGRVKTRRDSADHSTLPRLSSLVTRVGTRWEREQHLASTTGVVSATVRIGAP